MFRGKKIKYLMLMGLALALAGSLVAGACAPAAPPGEEAAEEIAELEAEIDELEDDLAAEKAQTKDLEDEIAALKKPVEVLKWEPSTWLPAGVVWDSLVYACDYIERMSDGRIEVTPSAPGAVCPVAEQLDAVSTGATEAMDVWPGYFPGKVAVTALQGGDAVIPVTQGELRHLYEVYDGGRINEIFREEYAAFGDVYFAGNNYWTCNNIMTSTVPIYGVDDLEGMKFRSSELIAIVLSEFGAGTVWTPGGEIYTMLATGAVDACTYSGTPDAIAMSFHEVTDYWVKEPVCLAGAANAWILNGTVWEALPDDLKAIVEAAIEVEGARNQFTYDLAFAEGWAFAEDYGIEIIVWSEEDLAEFYAMIKNTAIEEFTDPACKEYFDIAGRFMVEMGYWD